MSTKPEFAECLAPNGKPTIFDSIHPQDTSSTMKRARDPDEDDRGQLLIQAAKDGEVSTVQELLEQGANVLAFRAPVSNDEEGTPTPHTALQGACENGHLEVVRLLIEYGADVNAKDVNAHWRRVKRRIHSS